jgi:hypothetical protein
MRRVAVYTFVALVLPTVASAQVSFDLVGVRALGMGGAFVAVADDATAVHWNPAGLATGSFLGMTFEWDRFQSSNQKAPPTPGAQRNDSTLTAFGTLPFGLSYARFRTTRLIADPTGAMYSESLTMRQYGGTILQSIVHGLVVGSTLKMVQGKALFGPVQGQTNEDALDHAEDLEGSYDTKFDLDVGVMADLRKLRIGITSKNLTEPVFTGISGFALPLKRRTRVGVALVPSAGLTFALDVDLDTADPVGGLRRMIALGGESRLGARVAVRGGVRWNRDGAARPIAAAGGSVKIRQSLWVDGYYTLSQHDEDRGFGIAMRAGY